MVIADIQLERVRSVYHLVLRAVVACAMVHRQQCNRERIHGWGIEHPDLVYYCIFLCFRQSFTTYGMA